MKEGRCNALTCKAEATYEERATWGRWYPYCERHAKSRGGVIRPIGGAEPFTSKLSADGIQMGITVGLGVFHLAWATGTKMTPDVASAYVRREAERVGGLSPEECVEFLGRVLRINLTPDLAHKLTTAFTVYWTRIDQLTAANVLNVNEDIWLGDFSPDMAFDLLSGKQAVETFGVQP